MSQIPIALQLYTVRDEMEKDLVGAITRHGTRISLLHIKDMDPGDKSFAPIGTGLLPLDSIVNAALDAEVEYLIVEQDTSKEPSLMAVKTSLQNLKAKGYA
jgi:sugar phosphate isomerase/epimerase